MPRRLMIIVLNLSTEAGCCAIIDPARTHVVRCQVKPVLHYRLHSVFTTKTVVQTSVSDDTGDIITQLSIRVKLGIIGYEKG